jgi:acyl-coenzyme A thioesterase PaaI-like protein
MSPTTEGFPSGADIARRFLSISPYIGHLGIRLTMIQPDVAQLSLPFTDALVTTGTVVHGGGDCFAH